MNQMRKDLRAVIEEIPIADTHEHLVEEADRLKHGNDWALHDFAIFFMQYPISDLVSAGMPGPEAERLTRADVDPAEKWRLVAPWWRRIQYTGYGQCITRSIQLLFGIEELDDSTWALVDQATARAVKPGYYRDVIKRIARVDHVQVNSLQHYPFCETAQPELLLQDLSFIHLTVNPPVKALEEKSGIPVTSLDKFLEVIDWCFDAYGRRAIAMKSQAAYMRRLDYAKTTKSDATRAFEAYLREGESLDASEKKDFEDYLFHRCMEKAREYRLPVKLHTGYYAGTGGMPLHRVGANAGDVCELLREYPDVRFVLMHTMYPYQDEAIAIAKHYPNATIDMCWSWIVAPLASRRLLREMLTAAPVNKVLPFGGDFTTVEMIPGHAAMARDGIAAVISELVEEGIVRESDAVDLARTVLLENARAVFPSLERLAESGGRDQ